jgi:hypothetical protein
MSLPKLTMPQYTLTLPSTGETVLFRPFTVREETILLMAIDGEEEDQIRALRQVIQNCLLNSKLDLYKLPIFDIDYIWLKLRSKSVEEIVSLPLECRNALPDGKTETDEEGNVRDYCGTIVNVAINLDKMSVIKHPENKSKIELQDSIGIQLKYPTFETFQKLTKLQNQKEFNETLEVVLDCVEMIYDGKTGKTYEREYIDRQELIDFLESLSQQQFAKIMNFFDTLPAIRHEVHFKCPKCKHEADVVIEGTKSFLALGSGTNHSAT